MLTELHLLMLVWFSAYGGLAFIDGGKMGWGFWLLATAVAFVAAAAISWLLLAIGVKVGRSMELHAALSRGLNSPAPSPAVSMPPAPGLVDHGMPMVPPVLHKELIRDTLTGLWTREAILDQLRREMSRATRQGAPLGLVMVKLDHFDQMKKDYGDAVSEALLQRAAEHFVEGLREYDAAGRSGAEFLLVLPGWDPDANPQRVEGLLATIHMKPGTAAPDGLQLTASIGVASFHPNGDSPYAEDLLQRADMAVHAAQAAGRNRVEFAPGSTG